MKRMIAILLLLSLSAITLFSCQRAPVTAPSCEEVIAAYQAAEGYHVVHYENSAKDDELDDNCYVQVWAEDEYDCVYFSFFDSPEAAEARDAERQYNVLIYLFSVIYGDPSWLYSEAYGNIQYEYESEELLEPFEELIK